MTANTVQQRTVTLSQPVKIDGQAETRITLRKPKAGEMRGLMLVNVLQMEVGTLIRLLPRISTPPLAEDQIAEMDLVDITALGSGVVGFFNGVKLPEDTPAA